MNAPISKEQWAELRRQTVDDIGDIADQVGLPNVLLNYQSEAVGLLDTTGVEVLFIEKSRRIGMTWGLASYAVLKAAKEKKAGGSDAMYISYSQEMTREFIDACAMWARAYSLAAIEQGDFIFEDTDPNNPDETRKIQAFRIRFASDFEIIGLSSAPRSLRGKQGLVIIDEAAFVENLKELLKAAMAFLMWGGQVVICSTHDGTENEFNLQIQDILGDRSPYEHMRVDLDDALKDGLYQRICLVQGKEWTADAEADWRQKLIDNYGEGADEELFCIPTMGSGTWLSGPLIEARMKEDVPVLRLDLPKDYLHRSELEQAVLMAPFLLKLEEALADLPKDVRYAFGFDFARVADLTVGCLLAIETDLKRREVLSFELRNVPGHEQKQITKMVLDAVRSRLVGAAFDATGMGWTVAEDMGRLFGLREDPEGAGLIMPIKFSETWYRLEMPPLKVAFEDDMISLGRDSDHVSDLRHVKLVRGIPRVPEARTSEKGEQSAKAKKRHGDYAIALALAHYASRMRWSEFDYQPVPPKHSRHEETAGSDGDTPYRISSLRRSRGIFGWQSRSYWTNTAARCRRRASRPNRLRLRSGLSTAPPRCIRRAA
ncbi:terminase family protein [Roseibium porphyridii]|uniref:Terminase family protein n=1 Tax=Roseibium porphyridii TaxID=2866279 RepID=A0ABY8FA60_9HYPH|nr:terminase family protein [Roseibium sp. KMA01]WFE92294.1 terminase family protein [Roseibium sp. KMA01]